jgi:hypothetical protein
MQTFLPYPDYVGSARCLDNKRLGKQRLECKQILLALGVAVGPHKPGKRGWKNHPAVRMWKGHEGSLIVYSFCVCVEWRKRGFLDNLGNEFENLYCAMVDGPTVKPPWIGSDGIHASHRSNLLRKDAEFYGKFGWAEPDDLPYVWPV